MNRFVIKAPALVLACAGILLAGPGPARLGAQQNNDDWCAQDRFGRDRAGFCEVREFTVAATSGTLEVSGTNGGISVEGESRGDVRILAKVVATAETEQRARAIAGAVDLKPTLERVQAEGPRNLQNREGWSVSYRISVPRALNLSLRTSNGGITIREVESQVTFRTSNGGVKLIGVSGDVRGQTSNGGVDIDLVGTAWIGEGLDIETSNGGVKIAVPENYSARLEARTENGGVNADYPGIVQDRRGRDINVQLGSGGAPIKIRTSNGGVRVTRK
jgi:DUF4097 and DUF4098 domain-containing protein YvlB